MTRFEIEMKVADVFTTFADENNLDANFYGDCYPQDVMELENRMERMNNEEVAAALEELQENLKAWYL